MLTLEQKLLLACLSATPKPDQLSPLIKPDMLWDELLRLGEHHAVLPLIYQALKNIPDPLVPAPILNRLQRTFVALTLRNLQMQKELHRVIDLLTEEQIAVIPFKGPTLAEEAYGDIAMRSFVDLDLLVPADQAQVAVQVLLNQGYWTDFELPQARWAGLQRVDNHLPLYHSEQNWGVEIHWQLFHPMYVQPFDLSAHWFDLQGGSDLQGSNTPEGAREGRLEREETLVMLCTHGTKHFWAQLKWLVDIDRLLTNGSEISWVKVLSLASGSGSLRSLLLGLELSHRLFGTPLCDEVMAMISGDSSIHPLAENVIVKLFPDDPERKQYLQEYLFYLKSRDSLADQVVQVVRWLLWPRRADWEVFRLGDWWHALYYVERPVRIFVKHVLWPIFSGTRDGNRGGT